jgi:hypothetical protein
MAQIGRSTQPQRDSSLKTAAPRGREGGFKPVALPALAAAVAATRPPAPRKPATRDIPAILREDALVD